MKHNIIWICFIILFGSIDLVAFGENPNSLSEADKLRFLDSVNSYRIIKGVPPLRYSFQEDSLSRLRVASIYRHIDSIGDDEWKKDISEAQHFRFFEDLDVYDKNNVHPDTVLSWQGECTARLGKLFKIDDWVEELFHGWKNSPEHWKMMLDSDFEYMTLHLYSDTHRHIRLRKGHFAALVLFSKERNQRSVTPRLLH